MRLRRSSSNDLTVAQRAVLEHLRRSFGGSSVSTQEAPDEIVKTRVPVFRTAEVAPGPRSGLWSWVSLGCWDAVHSDGHGLEFVLMANERDRRHALRLAMIAYYHANSDASFRLDHGHTVPIGEPWSPGSACDHLLVSTPYPLGPDFEICSWDSGHVRILWLLPITEAERDFKAEHGIEALEQKFDAAALEYWDPQRASVV